MLDLGPNRYLLAPWAQFKGQELCFCAPVPSAATLSMPAKADHGHGSHRTVAEWASWALSEGHADITDVFPEGKNEPGKVYCSLCSKAMLANSKTIKAHCLGYFEGKGDKRTYFESKHALNPGFFCRQIFFFCKH